MVCADLRERTVDRPQDDSRLPSAHLDLPDPMEVVRRTEECRTRRFGEEDGSAVGLRQPLDARGGVDGVAVNGVLEPGTSRRSLT
jgi:hypothetical protein